MIEIMFTKQKRVRFLEGTAVWPKLEGGRFKRVFVRQWGPDLRG
jgi:hypothetical protein